MSRTARVALVLFAGLAAAGTWLDRQAPPAERPPHIMEADLHVHPFPGDGVLTVGALRREASRRGLDVIAITAHNNRFGLDADVAASEAADVIVLPGQEITTPGFHMIAVGVTRLIDWRLDAAGAIAAIHAQGGVAIAAHPVRASWRDGDAAALARLDGAEVAHPGRRSGTAGDEYLQFFHRARALNPVIAPIGSSDFHSAAPLGLCRTYLLVGERSAAGVLEAIRLGRTVASGSRGELFGAAAHVAEVEAYLAERGAAPAVTRGERLLGLLALAALAFVAAPRLRLWRG